MWKRSFDAENQKASITQLEQGTKLAQLLQTEAKKQNQKFTHPYLLQ
jgi:hypothetical protein